ncbi:MAG: glycosyltransferase family 2 protein [Phycisphaerae bacterium]
MKIKKTFMMHLTVSIVTYKNNILQLQRAVNCVAESPCVEKIYIIDNSPSNQLREITFLSEKIEYIFNNKNLGYGRANNIALENSIKNGVNYHLVLNPDIYFEKGVIEELYDFMEKNPDVGLVMPKILYPDGSLQYLCKLLPTPLDLIRRRFLPGNIFSKQNSFYELRFAGYNKIMDVPYLSGCFMFIRTEALRRVGLFDEQFFMYLEDADISRRIHKHYRTVYYPKVFGFHEYEKGSYRNSKLLKYHLFSAFRYFNKWGYFFDKDRREINQKVLEKLNAL